MHVGFLPFLRNEKVKKARRKARSACLPKVQTATFSFSCFIHFSPPFLLILYSSTFRSFCLLSRSTKCPISHSLGNHPSHQTMEMTSRTVVKFGPRDSSRYCSGVSLRVNQFGWLRISSSFLHSACTVDIVLDENCKAII